MVEGRTGVFVGVTEASIDPEFPDYVEDDVLGVDPGGEFAIDLDATDFRLLQRHGLRGEDVADLAGANAEGDGSEGAVRRGVRVAAGDGRARLGDALFGADNVHDALLAAGHIKKLDPGLVTIPA